jgi:sarcosine oxidase
MPHRVAVVGAGIVGLCAARALRERGAEVRVYERGEPGAGQSAGESRLFRHGHDDERMVEMAKRSRAIWTEWGEELGAELVSADGVLALGESALERLEILERVGAVGARRVGAAEVAEALPILAGYDGPAVLDADGGAIRTTTAIDRLAAALGEDLVADEVISLRPTARGVELRSGTELAEFDAAVVCAGRGTAALARTVGMALPVDLAAHVRATFAVTGDPPPRLACLQDSSGEFPETGVYAAPEPGNGRYSVGLSETLEASEDGGLADPEAFAALGERAVDYVRAALPGLDADPVGIVHCWVTELPWSEDGLGVWASDGIAFAAGHNLFKMAPALGRELARIAHEGEAGALEPAERLGEPRD